MMYLWELPGGPEKYIGVYESKISPDRFLFRQGIELDVAEVARCYVYVRSTLGDFVDDPFIRMQLRPRNRYAYIFTSDEMFCFAGSLVSKIKINAENFRVLKKMLSLTDDDIDNDPKILSDAQLEVIRTFVDYPQFSRIPVITVPVTIDMIEEKYDCIRNFSAAPIVNQKVVDILLQLAPNEVQFFDVELRCKDGISNKYKLLNLTRKITGIDHEKSIPSAFGFKYLTYHPGCMGDYKIARDAEYLGHILVTEEIKQAFEKAKIKGVRIVRPEDYYGPMTYV